MLSRPFAGESTVLLLGFLQNKSPIYIIHIALRDCKNNGLQQRVHVWNYVLTVESYSLKKSVDDFISFSDTGTPQSKIDQ